MGEVNPESNLDVNNEEDNIFMDCLNLFDYCGNSSDESDAVEDGDTDCSDESDTVEDVDSSDEGDTVEDECAKLSKVLCEWALRKFTIQIYQSKLAPCYKLQK